MKLPIPYGRQQITEEDIRAVTETLASDFLTQGPRIAEFEEAFARYVGAEFAVAVANGTAALHLCAMALEIKPGDKVITTPNTFAASANCVRYCGGEVVFADIDPDTFLLDLEAVRSLLSAAPKGTYKGLIPVDFAGLPVDLEAFRKLADEYDLWMIEDACHAPGAHFTDSHGNKQKAGNGHFADLAIFSFHPVKHIACGEGGMVTTNDPKLYQRLLDLRTHGITKDMNRLTNPVKLATGDEHSDQYPGWYMEMQELGYNYRLSDIHAVLGTSQLKRAKENVARRRSIARKYDEAFAAVEEIKIQAIPEGREHAYHLYVIEVPHRLQMFNYLREQGVLVQVHYIPTHLMPYYQSLGWKPDDFPRAEAYYKRCLSIPIYPDLTIEQQDHVIHHIRSFLNSSQKS